MQNIAEIDEIPWTEKDVEITLPAAESAIYLELEHYLRALEMTVKRGKKTESDREKKVAQSLGKASEFSSQYLQGPRSMYIDVDRQKRPFSSVVHISKSRPTTKMQ